MKDRDVKKRRRRRYCDGYAYYSKMIEGLKTNKSEIKASKLDKKLQCYGHLKFCMILISVNNRCSRLGDVAKILTSLER